MDIARGVLAGIALGGFATTMIEVNLFALKAFLRVNCLAVETAWDMFQAGVLQSQLRQKREAERDDDESET